MTLVRLLPGLLFLAAQPALTSESVAAQPPNIVFILTDDQGYGDLSCHGNPVLKTPQLDRLHADAVRPELAALGAHLGVGRGQEPLAAAVERRGPRAHARRSRGFGVMLSPVYYRRRNARPVSYYALFK